MLQWATYHSIILAMDRSNERDIKRVLPRATHHKVRLFCSLLPDEDVQDVPDPYYEGGHAGVVSLVERGVDALIAELQAQTVSMT